MERYRGILAVLVCASLSISTSPALGESAPSSANPSANQASARPSNPSGPMQGDERILHALNRFTFGPRPGDVEVVREIGLDKWFNQQLHPETLDHTGLDARLAQFPAMQDNPQGLLYRLPSNAVIRQIADGKAPIPADPELRPIYQNELARVELRRLEREQKKQEQPSIPANAINTPVLNSPAMNESAAKMAVEPTQPSSGQMIMTPAAIKPDQPSFDDSLIPGILSLTPEQRVARLATMTQPEFDSFRKALKPKQRAALNDGLNPAQKEYVAALENPQRVIVEELDAQRLTRDIYSNAQLQEVMTDFWLNHLNVYLHKNEATPYYLVSYERDTIRPRALGKFEDLLDATAHSPAMLLYLDNSSSMGPDSPAAERNKLRDARNPNARKKAPEGLNENYARELMELHTLGVNGGYTQADVTQVARILTGWTVDRPQRGGGFKFDENRHEPGTKRVLGKKIKENGEEEGRQLLHMLATRPATAQFLSRKLAVRFVSDNPPKSLVDRMAKSYLKSGGDISVVLNTLFHSPEFWSQDAYRAKVKTPIEYVVSAARASNANFDSMQPLVNALNNMGMPLYGAVPPTGYNWQSSAWVSTGALVNRMNFALSLAANKLPGISVNWPPPAEFTTAQVIEGNGTPSVVHQFIPGPTPSPAAEELRLESLLVAGGVSDSTRSSVLQQVDQQKTVNTTPPKPVAMSTRLMTAAQAAASLEKQDQLLAGLLLGSPEFQRR